MSDKAIPVGFDNGRLITRTATEDAALYRSSYDINGATYQAEALVYNSDGEWRVMVSAALKYSVKDARVYTVIGDGFSDACKKAFKFCARAGKTGEGVNFSE